MPRIISAAPIWVQNMKDLQPTARFNNCTWLVQERFVGGKGQQKIQIPTGLLTILSNHTVLCWNGGWSGLNLCMLNGYSGYGQWLVAFLWTAKMHHASLTMILSMILHHVVAGSCRVQWGSPFSISFLMFKDAKECICKRQIVPVRTC